MRAMVLAAGLGTRLKPLTDERPKPAVPVGNHPLAWYAISTLAKLGVRKVVLNAHHLAEELEAALRADLPDEIEPTFLRERRLLGTGGGVKNAEKHLVVGDDPIVVMNGDILFAPNLGAAVAHHRARGAIATMVVRPDPKAVEYGAVEVDGAGLVKRLLADKDAPELPGTTAYMFTGVHVLSPRAFGTLPKQGCIVREGYVKWLEAGEPVAAVVDESPWRDLGTKLQYLQANLELAAGRFPWPDLLRGARGNLIHPRAQLAPDARMTESVVGPGARIEPGTELGRTVVWDGARARGRLYGAIVTHRAVIQVL